MAALSATTADAAALCLYTEQCLLGRRFWSCLQHWLSTVCGLIGESADVWMFVMRVLLFGLYNGHTD